jgi:spermidine synthase
VTDGTPVGGAWLIDSFDADDFQGHRISRTVVSRRTKYQKVDILENDGLGLFLVLDGKMQSAQSDEFIYHEALVHPAMICHPAPRTALILGGGEGATLREVLRHPTVERVTMVDIDEELVDLCKEHLPTWHQGAFDDARTELLCMDAWEYLRGSTARFDVIFSDVTDLVGDGLAAALYTQDFYRLVERRLAPEGYFASQALAIRLGPTDRQHAAIRQGLRSVFPGVSTYVEFVPSFDSLWGFVLASRRVDAALPTPAEVSQRLASRGLGSARYFDATAYSRLFALPRNLRHRLDEFEAGRTPAS